MSHIEIKDKEKDIGFIPAYYIKHNLLKSKQLNTNNQKILHIGQTSICVKVKKHDKEVISGLLISQQLIYKDQLFILNMLDRLCLNNFIIYTLRSDMSIIYIKYENKCIKQVTDFEINHFILIPCDKIKHVKLQTLSYNLNTTIANTTIKQDAIYNILQIILVSICLGIPQIDIESIYSISTIIDNDEIIIGYIIGDISTVGINTRYDKVISNFLYKNLDCIFSSICKIIIDKWSNVILIEELKGLQMKTTNNNILYSFISTHIDMLYYKHTLVKLLNV